MFLFISAFMCIIAWIYEWVSVCIEIGEAEKMKINDACNVFRHIFSGITVCVYVCMVCCVLSELSAVEQYRMGF